MQFRIADTFQASLAKLTNQEQKAVKITAFDLQADPTSQGLSFHKLDRAKDPNFWSVRVNRDIRLIVHRTPESMLIAYVDHHDDAYAWAERRRIEVHPRTGAAQLVEVRETVEEIPIRPTIQEPSSEPAEPYLFATEPGDEVLLTYGVPEDWLADVRRATESGLFNLLEHLPQEAAEALLELATGGTPMEPTVVTAVDPYQHPDALRRFRIMDNAEELKLALDYPWEKWTVFLHPVQRQYVEKDFKGPVRIGGTAGTGKTVVALHRTVWLARRNPDARILLTTFSQELAENLKVKIARLEHDRSVLNRIEVRTLPQVAVDLHKEMIGPVEPITEGQLREVIGSASGQLQHSFSQDFIAEEWRDVVDAWGVLTWDAYQVVPRLGRKTRLGANQRENLWSIFERVRALLSERGLPTERMIQETVADEIDRRGNPYDFVVVDEAQDISVSQLRFANAITGERPDGLFFAGDLGQRIFQMPFSWKSLGVDIRGRSFTLRINYRTSHQIRLHADRLLPKTVRDIDGNEEDRRGVVSVFDGSPPTIIASSSPDDEAQKVAEWLNDLLASGLSPAEIGVFVRSEREEPRAKRAVDLAHRQLDDGSNQPVHGISRINIATMHLAKGLEYRAVAVMACDDEVIPNQDRIVSVVDEADLQEVYDTERHLLYVACTRARDHLLVSGVEPMSEFIGDLLD